MLQIVTLHGSYLYQSAHFCIIADYVQPPPSLVLYRGQGHGSVTDHSPTLALCATTGRNCKKRNSVTRCSFQGAKMFAAGALPRTPLGCLQSSLRLPLLQFFCYDSIWQSNFVALEMPGKL